MAHNVHNPFANYGAIVCGKQFVGRVDAIKTIQDRVIRPDEPGCLAIIGGPRIGKSSLAYHSLILPHDQLLQQGILTSWISLAVLDTCEALFRRMVSSILDILDDANALDDNMSRVGQKAMQTDQLWLDLYDQVQRFFVRLKRAGWRVVLVIDEFDAARFLFRENLFAFQALRELAYNPQWRIGLVTTSRRTIREIETKSEAISNLDGIFHKLFLGCFSDGEQREMLKGLEEIGFDVDNCTLEFVKDATGNHPYLTATLAFHLAEIWIDHHCCAPEQALERASLAFLDYYDDLVRLLREDSSLDKLLQITFGPTPTATRVDAERLEKYGLIEAGSEGYYVPFSSHFTEYLRLIERTVALWPLWSQTERALRSSISEVMERKYGAVDWIPEMEKAQIKLRPMLDRCRESRAKEQQAFGAHASNNLLDFTYPNDLFQIIGTHWNLFGPILGRDKHYWSQRFELLSKVRTPMAHNRDEVLEMHEREIAGGYCREILLLLSNLKEQGGDKSD